MLTASRSLIAASLSKNPPVWDAAARWSQTGSGERTPRPVVFQWPLLLGPFGTPSRALTRWTTNLCLNRRRAARSEIKLPSGFRCVSASLSWLFWFNAAAFVLPSIYAHERVRRGKKITIVSLGEAYCFFFFSKLSYITDLLKGHFTLE